VPGVTDVCHQTWFGGIYQDPKNFFMQMPVEPECLLRLYPEFRLSEAEQKAWFADREGAVVGRATAEKFGWKVGQRIPLQATIWRKKDNSSTWEFNLDGIYDGAEKGTDTTLFFFHYDYFDESRLFGSGEVGWYVIRIADPARAPAIAAELDGLFANSPAETKTTTERAFAQAFAKQVGDTGAIVRAILGAVFFTILLVAANTMAQSVRERTSELAVLKTLRLHRPARAGARAGRIARARRHRRPLGARPRVGVDRCGRRSHRHGHAAQFLPPDARLAYGVLCLVGVGVVAGIFPALQAMRLRIVDALRQV